MSEHKRGTIEDDNIIRVYEYKTLRVYVAEGISDNGNNTIRVYAHKSLTVWAGERKRA